MDLCKYKNALGKPHEGIHSFRVLDIAIMDVLMTILVAGFLSLYLKQNFWLVLVMLFLLGIFLHRIFCVRTTVDKILFSDSR